MATKLISVLGQRGYKETVYVYNKQEYSTPFMVEAAFHFFKPDQLLVLVTEEVRDSNLPLLKGRLPETIPVYIPSGKTEEELWKIFDALATNVLPGDEIIFDITNGFRSLPVLCLFAASFVQVARNAQVIKMIYGAFDARDEATNTTPVFDLTPFLNLLDWTTATDAFLKYGRADDLVSLAREDYSELADTLNALTKSLQTSRTAGVMQSAYGLSEKIFASRNTQSISSKPFGLLLDQINEEYGRFGLDNPTNHIGDYLEKQLEMIKWYLSKGMYVQALTSMREWLITLIMYDAQQISFSFQDRDVVAKFLRGSSGQSKSKDKSVSLEVLKNNLNPELYQKVNQLWDEVPKLRNDVAHSGMGHDARSFDEIKEKSQEFYTKLEELLDFIKP
jgi:CRISPR-associated protein, TM1812 family